MRALLSVGFDARLAGIYAPGGYIEYVQYEVCLAIMTWRLIGVYCEADGQGETLFISSMGVKGSVIVHSVGNI